MIYIVIGHLEKEKSEKWKEKSERKKVKGEKWKEKKKLEFLIPKKIWAVFQSFEKKFVWYFIFSGPNFYERLPSWRSIIYVEGGKKEKLATTDH
jgi:hypothetical protein